MRSFPNKVPLSMLSVLQPGMVLKCLTDYGGRVIGRVVIEDKPAKWLITHSSSIP
jgi:hypothetical protein